jgi:HK97 gp10 family phage protein
MAYKAKFQGREAVMRRLNQMVPDAERELAAVQMEVAEEAASRIGARARSLIGGTGDYHRSIEADRIANRPKNELIGITETKDKNATGVFAKWTWRFLEFGTVHMARRPHIFPTWRAFRKTARRKMASAVNKAVRKAKG